MRKRTKQGGKYYLTRELARGIAKVNMKKGGIVLASRLVRKVRRKKAGSVTIGGSGLLLTSLPSTRKIF